MALQASGPIKWSQITAEFGEPTINGISSLGHYRIAQPFGGVNSDNSDSLILPLDNNAGPNSDTDIPGPDEPISFSNFYNSRLNIAVDYYSIPENRPQDAKLRYDNTTKKEIVGGFTGTYPSTTSASKVVIAVNNVIGGVRGDEPNTASECSLKTGSGWVTGTKVRVDVGPVGKIIGAGGDGGTGGGGLGNAGGNGSDGSGALGIQYGTSNEPCMVNVKGGRIITGYGGGGGGGGAYEFENNPERAAAGGGGGGGAGLPAGLGGDVESATSGNHNCDGPVGNDGSTAADGEQGGLGGGTFTNITKGDIVDSEYGTDNTYIPLGNVWSGCDEGNKEEAISGGGGRGRDQTVTGTTGVDNGEGHSGMARKSEYIVGAGGDAGNDGGAIRKTDGSIIWEFDAAHQVNTVFGDGKNGSSESPTGVT